MHANNTKSTYVHLTYSDTQKAHLCLSENTYICIVPCTSNGTGHVNTRIIMTDKNRDILTFHQPDTSSRQELPVAGGDVKAGFPSPADDFIDSPLDLNREFVHNPSATFFVRVSGDSMAGDGIGDGDLLIVDRINNMDTLEVQVEVEERFFSDEIRELENLTNRIAHVIQQAIGLSVKVKLVEPKSIERSMGKTQHVIDKRKLK